MHEEGTEFDQCLQCAQDRFKNRTDNWVRKTFIDFLNFHCFFINSVQDVRSELFTCSVRVSSVGFLNRTGHLRFGTSLIIRDEISVRIAYLFGSVPIVRGSYITRI